MMLIKVTTVFDIVVDTHKAYNTSAKHASVPVTSRCSVKND